MRIKRHCLVLIVVLFAVMYTALLVSGFHNSKVKFSSAEGKSVHELDVPYIVPSTLQSRSSLGEPVRKYFFRNDTTDDPYLGGFGTPKSGTTWVMYGVFAALLNRNNASLKVPGFTPIIFHNWQHSDEKPFEVWTPEQLRAYSELPQFVHGVVSTKTAVDEEYVRMRLLCKVLSHKDPVQLAVVRHPMEVVRSFCYYTERGDDCGLEIQDLNSWAGVHFRTAISYLNAIATMIRRTGDGGRIGFVRYEDCLKDDFQCLKGMFDFWGLCVDDASIKFGVLATTRDAMQKLDPYGYKVPKAHIPMTEFFGDSYEWAKQFVKEHLDPMFGYEQEEAFEPCKTGGGLPAVRIGNMGLGCVTRCPTDKQFNRLANEKTKNKLNETFFPDAASGTCPAKWMKDHDDPARRKRRRRKKGQQVEFVSAH